jgi:hypothetical protein
MGNFLGNSKSPTTLKTLNGERFAAEVRILSRAFCDYFPL